MVRHSLDKSERALATVPSTVVGEQYPHPTYTSEEERKVVRKIDCIIYRWYERTAFHLIDDANVDSDVLCVLLSISGQTELELCFRSRANHRLAHECISVLVVLQHILHRQVLCNDFHMCRI
jgi:hypothetical protein